MERQNFLPELELPKLSLGIEIFWTLLGIILGVFSLFTPEIESLALWYRIGILFAVIILSIILPMIIKWCLSALRVIFLRARYYPEVIQNIQHISEELEQTRKSLLFLASLSTKDNAFTILKVKYHNGKLYILVEKKRSPRLVVNDKLLVIDTENGASMGTFKISQVRQSDYYAVEYENVSPIWIGYIRQEMRSELEAPPNTFAILTSGGRNNDQ